MTSYPSNAIKVRPIATTRPDTPFGKKSSKLLGHVGLENAIANKAAAINNPIIVICVKVIALPTLLVGDAPLTLIKVNAIMASAASPFSSITDDWMIFADSKR